MRVEVAKSKYSTQNEDANEKRKSPLQPFFSLMFLLLLALWPCFLPFWSKIKNRSKPNFFPFSARNIFFLRKVFRKCPQGGAESGCKWCAEEGKTPFFLLFGGRAWSKSGWHGVWKVLFAAYMRGVPVRKVCFFVVQKVTGRGFVADKKVSVECARIVFSGPRLSVRPNSAIQQGVDWQIAKWQFPSSCYVSGEIRFAFKRNEDNTFLPKLQCFKRL